MVGEGFQGAFLKFGGRGGDGAGEEGQSRYLPVYSV